jgi:hypothetical protein
MRLFGKTIKTKINIMIGKMADNPMVAATFVSVLKEKIVTNATKKMTNKLINVQILICKILFLKKKIPKKLRIAIIPTIPATTYPL